MNVKKPKTTGGMGPHIRIEVSVSNLTPGGRALIERMFNPVLQQGRALVRAGTGSQAGSVGSQGAKLRSATSQGSSDVVLVVAVPTDVEMDGV